MNKLDTLNFIKTHWLVILCVLLLIIQFPLIYFSFSTTILGNDLAEHVAQARLTDNFFHTWWNENGVGGNPSNLLYPPVILLFSWFPFLIKILFFLATISAPIFFNRIVIKYFKDTYIQSFTTLLFTWLLFEKTHMDFFPGVGGVLPGSFTSMLALTLMFIYWRLTLDRKENPFLLAFIILTNPIYGIFATIITIIYSKPKRIVKIGMISFALTAWWIIPYVLYNPFGRSIQFLEYYAVPFTIGKYVRFTLFGFITTGHTLPIIICGLLGLLFIRNKKLALFIALTIIIPLFSVLGWHKRLSFFILLSLCIASGYVFEKLPKIAKHLMFTSMLVLLIATAIITTFLSSHAMGVVYSADKYEEPNFDTKEGYYFSIDGPFQYMASDDMNMAMVPFARATTAASFRKLFYEWLGRNTGDFEYVFPYFQINYLESGSSSLATKYDFIFETNASGVKKIASRDEYPIFVLNNMSEVRRAELPFTRGSNQTAFERFNETAYYVYHNSVSDCIINYTQDNNDVMITTACVGKPHVVKISYHPLWRISHGADELRPFAGHYMMLTPTQEKIMLRFGPNWWMVLLYILFFITLIISIIL